MNRGVAIKARVGHGVRRSPEQPSLRADARRNLERVLAAARDVFAEQGPAARLDAIARRAGVGIGTLYRRFPNRATLARAVALDIWQRVAQEAERASAEEPDAFAALASYMHRALDLRTGAVMPVVTSAMPMDDELRRARDAAVQCVQDIMAAAQAAGTLRGDVTYGDTGLILIRLSRPLPGVVPRALDDEIAHRQLHLLLDGLRTSPGYPSEPLPGPALTLDDLRSLAPAARRAEGTEPTATAFTTRGVPTRAADRARARAAPPAVPAPTRAKPTRNRP
jgi:AcrR family transcriptional regulator